MSAWLNIFAKTAAECKAGGFFGLPHWFEGLSFTDDCSVRLTALSDIWIVVANLVRLALGAAGLVAIAFMIVGGFTYITSQGEPDRLKKALGTMINAAIGLVIAIGSSAIIGFIAGRF